MRLSLRKRPAVKSAVYTLLLLVLLLFSSSFYPALRLTLGTPNLLLPALALIACFEGAEYALIFALLFGVLETYMLAENILVYPLFYLLFAFLCARFLRGSGAHRVWLWLILVAAGLACHTALGLFPAVAHWQVPATDLLDRRMGESLLLSLLLALPLYPLFRSAARKTDLS